MALRITYQNSELNAKQQRFCEEYLIDLNGTQAAIRAGYSKKTASAIAVENLQKPAINSYVAKLKETRSEATKITANRILRELSNIAYGNMKDFIDFDENGIKLKPKEDIGDDNLGIISELNLETKTDKEGNVSRQTKFKIYPKDNAIALIMRHLGLFEKDNSQQSKDITVVIKKSK